SEEPEAQALQLRLCAIAGAAVLSGVNVGSGRRDQPHRTAALQENGSGEVQFECVSECLRSWARFRCLAQAEPRSARVQSYDRIFHSCPALRSPRPLAVRPSSHNSRRPSKRAAKETGRTKYRTRKISKDASSSSLANCGSPASIAASMTPRLPG